jgi:hypothetical protein
VGSADLATWDSLLIGGGRGKCGETGQRDEGRAVITTEIRKSESGDIERMLVVLCSVGWRKL